MSDSKILLTLRAGQFADVQVNRLRSTYSFNWNVHPRSFTSLTRPVLQLALINMLVGSIFEFNQEPVVSKLCNQLKIKRLQSAVPVDYQ